MSEIRVAAYRADSGSGPGTLAAVPLEVEARGEAELALPEATIRDERGDLLFPAGEDGDLSPDPCGGGPPTAGDEERLEARRFGLTNVAHHTQRALRAAADLLGAPLPHLVVRVGLHDRADRPWGGGHYRVPARRYEPPEPQPVSGFGEVHLGGGSRFVAAAAGEPYFAAPAHNRAIIYHEIGHHLCRHTADFRLNGLRAAGEGTNKKVALDEGTCDFFTAVMLATTDIYGWHRSALPLGDHRRRALGPTRTMAGFEGGSADPHADGTIWASACWTARDHVAEAGHDPVRFDRMLLGGLGELGRAATPRGGGGTVDQATLKRRRYFGGLLDAMVRSDPELSDPVLAGMAEHGVRPGPSNTQLRDDAQVPTPT